MESLWLLVGFLGEIPAENNLLEHMYGAMHNAKGYSKDNSIKLARKNMAFCIFVPIRIYLKPAMLVCLAAPSCNLELL